MTQCQARRRLVQSLVPTQGVTPTLAPSYNKAGGLPAHYQLLSHLFIWNFSGSLGSNPHRVITTSDNSAGSSGSAFFHSRGAKQVLLSSLELLLSLPPRLDPMPTANSQSRALQPPKACGRDHPSEASGVSPGKHQENMEAAAPKGSPSMTLHH